MARQGFPSDKQDQFMVRMPEGMRARIKAASERNNRSMNAEIVATLEKAYPVADYEALAFALVEVLQKMPEDESEALTDLIKQWTDKWIR